MNDLSPIDALGMEVESRLPVGWHKASYCQPSSQDPPYATQWAFKNDNNDFLFLTGMPDSNSVFIYRAHVDATKNSHELILFIDLCDPKWTIEKIIETIWQTRQ